jgi:tetratricopeptide (TPR) repeat protein
VHKWGALSQLLYYYRDINDIENQDKYYLKLIKIDPDYFKIHYAEFLFENRRKLDTAIILSEEINKIPDFRNDHWGQFLNAHSLASSGNIEKAVQQYSSWMETKKEIWESGEDYWILYFYAKFANFYSVDLEKALQYIQIAERNRNMVDEKILMADILFKLGKINESIEKLEESLNMTNNQNEYKLIEAKINDYKTFK